MFEVKEIEAKSILVPSKLPDADYVINPYTGCRFGCVYCYASFMTRYVGKDLSDWGEFVYVKVNTPKLLVKEVRRLKNHGAGKTIFLSSVTDPYQGVEAQYKLTRQCLQVLVEQEFQGDVSILTKSDLVLRDIDLLKQLPHVDVGLTITSTDDGVSRYFEKYAPAVSKRLEALTQLHQKSIKTYAFVGPLLPHFTANPQKLEKVFAAIAATGTEELYVEHINLSNYILTRLQDELKAVEPEILQEFYQSKNTSYRKELDVLVQALIAKYQLKLRMGDTIYHQEMMKK